MQQHQLGVETGAVLFDERNQLVAGHGAPHGHVPARASRAGSSASRIGVSSLRASSMAVDVLLQRDVEQARGDVGVEIVELVGDGATLLEVERILQLGDDGQRRARSPWRPGPQVAAVRARRDASPRNRSAPSYSMTTSSSGERDSDSTRR